MQLVLWQDSGFTRFNDLSELLWSDLEQDLIEHDLSNLVIFLIEVELALQFDRICL